MKEYLGDSVYATWGYRNSVILTTENGLPTDPSNTIYLEQSVIKALLRFNEQHNNESQSNKATETDQAGTED